VFGRVVQGRLAQVAHNRREVCFTRLDEFLATRQRGGAVVKVSEHVSVYTAPFADFQTSAVRPGERGRDGGLPFPDVPLVEKHGRRCGPPVEVEVFGVKREVRDRLNAHDKPCGPAGTIGERAARPVAARLRGEVEKVGRVFRVTANVLGGSGAEIRRGAESVEVGAGGVPVAGRPGRGHGLPGEPMGYT
jgi:hypothetical protein